MTRLLAAFLIAFAACSSHDAPAPMPQPPPNAPHPQADPVGDELVPPELIMLHQGEIELTAEQRTAIEAGLRDTQQQIVPLQFAMEAAREKLVTALKAIPADEAAVLAAAADVMARENQVKHLHLQLMVRIRNQLTPVQLAKLRALPR
jgi:Spy/CpxP family protein refolding chaperone